MLSAGLDCREIGNKGLSNNSQPPGFQFFHSPQNHFSSVVFEFDRDLLANPIPDLHRHGAITMSLTPSISASGELVIHTLIVFADTAFFLTRLDYLS